MSLAGFFTGRGGGRKPPPKNFAPRKGKGPSLADFQRTYGNTDGKTMFQAHLIKQKRGRKR